MDPWNILVHFQLPATAFTIPFPTSCPCNNLSLLPYAFTPLHQSSSFPFVFIHLHKALFTLFPLFLIISPQLLYLLLFSSSFKDSHLYLCLPSFALTPPVHFLYLSSSNLIITSIHMYETSFSSSSFHVHWSVFTSLHFAFIRPHKPRQISIHVRSRLGHLSWVLSFMSPRLPSFAFTPLPSATSHLHLLSFLFIKPHPPLLMCWLSAAFIHLHWVSFPHISPHLRPSAFISFHQTRSSSFALISYKISAPIHHTMLHPPSATLIHLHWTYVYHLQFIPIPVHPPTSWTPAFSFINLICLPFNSLLIPSICLLSLSLQQPHSPQFAPTTIYGLL